MLQVPRIRPYLSGLYCLIGSEVGRQFDPSVAAEMYSEIYSEMYSKCISAAEMYSSEARNGSIRSSNGVDPKRIGRRHVVAYNSFVRLVRSARSFVRSYRIRTLF